MSAMESLVIPFVILLVIQSMMLQVPLLHRRINESTGFSVIDIEYTIGFPEDEYLGMLMEDNQVLMLPVVEEAVEVFMPEDLINVEGYENN